jgi:hypothetical protein
MYRFEMIATYGPNDRRIVAIEAEALTDALVKFGELHPDAECQVLGSIDLTPQRALAFPPSERDLNNAWGV